MQIYGDFVEGRIVERGGKELSSYEVRVTIIRGGISKNGYVYDDQALKRIAELVEGAQAYADHGADGTNVRSVKDLVGFYHDARYIPAPDSGSAGRVEATLHILEAATWLWVMIREACLLGKADLVGLSIDILAQWRLNQRTKAKEVMRIIALNSCDIVTRPSAGGALLQILHHATRNKKGVALEGGDVASNESMATENAEINIDMRIENINMSQAEVDGEVLYMSDMKHIDSMQHVGEHNNLQDEQVVEQQRNLEELLREVRLEKAELLLERKLLESRLPDAVREHLAGKYKGKLFEARDLEEDITSARAMMAKLTQDNLVRGHAFEKTEISMQVTEAEKVQAAFDRMFDLEVDRTKVGNIRAFPSIREAYARVTGDASLAAGISTRSVLGTIHVSESAPLGRISEADVTTASFSYLLGTSMNKRLLMDYQAWPAEWQKLVTIVSIRDFKQQARVRLGAFGTLPVVAENNPYTAVTLGDSAAAYVPQKRGNLVTVSRETILNDDLQAIKQIPSKLAVAAAYTLAEFVYTFLTSNATIYDGSALFTTGAPHTNLGNTALSSGALQTGVSAMRTQSNFAGKRLGLRPRFLLVPPELEWTSMILTKSASIPGSANNDINPMQGYVTPVIAPQLTSTTQWFLVADPREIDTIEIGFVGGETNPTLYIQDMPLVGLHFSQDAITYKIRHEYGGAVVDYRGLYRGN